MSFVPSGFYLHASGLKRSVHLCGKYQNKDDILPVYIRQLMKQWSVLKEPSRNPYYFSGYLSFSQEEKTK
jgi:hypothetical protein